MQHSSKILNYPLLQDWYDKRKKATPLFKDPIEELIFATCELLIHSTSYACCKKWCSLLSSMFTSEKDVQDEYCDVEDAFSGFNTALGNILSDIAIIALQNGSQNILYDCMSKIADRSSIVSFRFIAAWVALNSNNLRACIKECEIVSQPFAALLTIQGQALLELGEVKESITILRKTVSKYPEECLAWFQLAKAYHIQGEFDDAWQCLTTIKEIIPNNFEITTFMALTVMSQKPPDSMKLEIVWEDFRELILSERPGDVSLFICLFDLAFLSNEEERIEWILNHTNIHALCKDEIFIQQISKILRKMRSLNWAKAEMSFLDKLIDHGKPL